MQAKSKILVVDDDPFQREMVRGLFEGDKNNYEVLEAPDAMAGLETAARELPHLIICDVLMPRLTAFDFIAAVRTTPDIRHIPILVCSAKQPPVDRECLELGANAYMVKPVVLDALLSQAKTLLGHTN